MYIGMECPVYRVISAYTPKDETPITYESGNGAFLDEAVSANVSETIQDVMVRTNNRTRLWDNGLNEYTMDLEVGDIPAEAYEKVLGYRKNTTGTSGSETVTGYTRTGGDSPEVSFGWIRNVQNSGTEKYWEAFWFLRTKWSQNSNAFRTQDRTKEYAMATINGRGMEVEQADGTAEFYEYMRFDTEEAAKTWLFGSDRANIATT